MGASGTSTSATPKRRRLSRRSRAIAPAIAAARNTSKSPPRRKGRASSAPRAAVRKRLFSDAAAAQASRSEARRSGPVSGSRTCQSGRCIQISCSPLFPRRLRSASARSTERSKSRYADADVCAGSKAPARSTAASESAMMSRPANPVTQEAMKRKAPAAARLPCAAQASASGRAEGIIGAPPRNNCRRRTRRRRAAAPARRAARPAPGSGRSTPEHRA